MLASLFCFKFSTSTSTGELFISVLATIFLNGELFLAVFSAFTDFPFVTFCVF